MDKITKLSPYGFKLESTGDQWNRCDNRLINSQIFKSLKIGDIIEKAIVNKKGFITEINLNSEGSKVYTSTKIYSSINTQSSPQNNILKGQCLNLVFNAMFCNGADNYNIENSDMRERAIKLSKKLYDELKDAKF
jgi:hypothetical protein